MKKLILPVLAFGIFAFTSCNSDDDSNDSENDCVTCDISSISTEYCDNGDGTATITAAGASQTITLPDGQSLSDYLDALDSSSDDVTCN
ncbi:MAG: hypothetical protein HRT67_09500 [Flavobacteriaceae bacterium]|nr:hypothetical protein [Flavobacteriaceae bacterium]